MPNDVAAALPDSAGAHAPAALDLVPAIHLKSLPADLKPIPNVAEAGIAGGEAAWISLQCPLKSQPNEDSVAVLPWSGNRGLLMVADGLGGHRGGRRASQLMKTLLAKAAGQANLIPQPHFLSKLVPVPGVIQNPSGDFDPRTVILNEIERANQRLLRSRVGAATTLALAELQGNRVRSYHVGDSEILVVTQRGRIKYSTVSHSPIGYAVQSGLLTEEEALFHPDRHLVSNVIGSDQMSVEIGPWVQLSPRDTVLLASDGLFDNLLQAEIVDCVRKGKLGESVRELATVARERMLQPATDFPSKPDDLTILAFRAQPATRKSA